MIEKLKNLRYNLEQDKGKRNQLIAEQKKQLSNIKYAKRILYAHTSIWVCDWKHTSGSKLRKTIQSV